MLNLQYNVWMWSLDWFEALSSFPWKFIDLWGQEK